MGQWATGAKETGDGQRLWSGNGGRPRGCFCGIERLQVGLSSSKREKPERREVRRPRRLGTRSCSRRRPLLALLFFGVPPLGNLVTQGPLFRAAVSAWHEVSERRTSHEVAAGGLQALVMSLRRRGLPVVEQGSRARRCRSAIEYWTDVRKRVRRPSGLQEST